MGGSVDLVGGRRLAWHEYGDPAGLPCLYVTGTQASGLAGRLYDKAAADAGVRWISLDKPGFGGSTRSRARSLGDWPADVAAVADALGLERFVVAGESGGGPHALAVAHALPQRVAGAVVVAGMGPADDAPGMAGMSRTNQRVFQLARRAPWALHLPFGAIALMARDKDRARRVLVKQAAGGPPADLAAWDEPGFAAAFAEAVGDALRHGAGGAVDEFRLLARPWGFRYEEVAVPVVLLHGEQDVNVPVAAARRAAAALPAAQLRTYPGLGHLLCATRAADVVAAVREADV